MVTGMDGLLFHVSVVLFSFLTLYCNFKSTFSRFRAGVGGKRGGLFFIVALRLFVALLLFEFV